MRRKACLGVALLLALAVLDSSSASAQFEEPDTVRRFAIGPTAEVVFRGNRGAATAGAPEVSFGGGPQLGLRIEYRLGRTVALRTGAAWARLDEKQTFSSAAGGQQVSTDQGFTQYQFIGELQLKVKPNIPGYFILGGGVRLVDPDEPEPNDLRLHNRGRSFTDPLGILGAGLALGARSSRVFKLDLRFYLVSPADQRRMQMESLAVDFAIGGTYLFRF